MKKIVHREPVASLRKPEYPPVGDQLDAMWKLLLSVVPATKDDPTYLKVKAVKDKFQKIGEVGHE